MPRTLALHHQWVLHRFTLAKALVGPMAACSARIMPRDAQ